MSDACNRTPFWQRQPLLPREVQDFLRARIEAALADPESRRELVWPTVLGAAKLLEAHPGGLPESLLLAHSARLLAALGQHDPGTLWTAHLAAWPDTAQKGPDGWRPSAAWGGWGPLVSLRSGWQLAALTPLAQGDGYALASGVSLFNHGLFHECHDALEPLWAEASGELKDCLQGLILMAGGYHHLQLHNQPGMLALWGESMARLRPCGGRFSTPWGRVNAEAALDLTARRLDHGVRIDEGADFTPFWALDRPTWELA